MTRTLPSMAESAPAPVVAPADEKPGAPQASFPGDRRLTRLELDAMRRQAREMSLALKADMDAMARK